MGVKSTIVGVLAGAAIGATVGILFAPSKGSVTRRRFSKKGFDYTEELEEKFNELIDSITDQFETMVEEVNRMAKEGKLDPEASRSM
jgi:gas vesicle protein